MDGWFICLSANISYSKDLALSSAVLAGNREAALDRQHAQIDSLEGLQAWLKAKGIDTSEWGRGAAKSVENLFEEIIGGESILQDDPPRRVVSVAQVLVHKEDRILLEAAQEFGDGRIRSRNRPLGEKMKPDEDYRDAAIRGIQEELGVSPETITLFESSYRQKQDEILSPSYLGLCTRYIFHVVEADVDGLPDTDFWTAESSGNPKDPISRHHWTWQRMGDE